MLHALVSDIHANLEALDSVLADIERRGADDIACLGDFVGYGASPNECMARLRPHIELAVLGNHDQAAIDSTVLVDFNPDAAAAARWTGRQLQPENAAWLAALPYSVVWHGARLVHAAPADPEAWDYVLSPYAAETEMAHCAEPVCFVGHSHVPCTFELQGERATVFRDPLVQGSRHRRYLIVVPSVGQPRDGDPRAGYLLWDDQAWTFEHVRLAYDLEGAQTRILGAGLPPSLANRLRWGE